MQQNDPVPRYDVKVDIALREQNSRVNVVKKASFDVIGVDQSAGHH